MQDKSLLISLTFLNWSLDNRHENENKELKEKKKQEL